MTNHYNQESIIISISENFHSVINKYTSKQYFFSHMSMLTRTYCAALDHNYNIDRQQVLLIECILKINLFYQDFTAAGEPKFIVVKNRHGKKYYAKVVKDSKDHSWRDFIANLIHEVPSKKLNTNFRSFLCIVCWRGDNAVC